MSDRRRTVCIPRDEVREAEDETVATIGVLIIVTTDRDHWTAFSRRLARSLLSYSLGAYAGRCGDRVAWSARASRCLNCSGTRSAYESVVRFGAVHCRGDERKGESVKSEHRRCREVTRVAYGTTVIAPSVNRYASSTYGVLSHSVFP